MAQNRWRTGDAYALDNVQKRQVSIVASGAWESPDGAYELSHDTHESKFVVTDQSLAHKAYCGVSLASIMIPGYETRKTAIVGAYLDVQGASWATMPSAAATFKLHVAGGTVISISDASANVTELNARHQIAYSGSYIDVSTDDRMMIEVSSPTIGTGSGRTYTIYRCVLQLATVFVKDGVSYYDDF